MARLNSITLQSPGTLGLNTQDQDSIQDHRYSTQALNCVISRNGLLEARQGAKALNGSAATGTPALDVVFSYVEDDGTENIISTGGNKLWVGTTSLTDKTGTLTVTADNWQFQNYAGEVFGYQSGHAPIFWDGGAGAFVLLSTHAGAAGLVNSKCHLSAFGRSWVVDTTTVSQINYSDLLVPADFTNGSAGTIDLNTVWPYSNDTITALAAHNNNLIIFCEKSIIIYGNAHDINNLYLIEVIRDIGCVARDTIQNIGDDIFFLANDGVRSLARTIIQDNMPQSEVSENIRDDLIDTINSATLTSVRSTYNEKQGFYVLNFPEQATQYVCDVRLATQDIFRWTVWSGAFYGVETSKANTNNFYIGLDGGFLANYDSYYDTDTSTGVVDQTYIVKFRSSWFHPATLSNQWINGMQAIWKKAKLWLATIGTVQAKLLWSFDFNDQDKSLSKEVTGIGGSKYGSFKYGSGTKYGGTLLKQNISYTLKGVGEVVRVGFQSVIDGKQLAFNRILLFYKNGRI